MFDSLFLNSLHERARYFVKIRQTNQLKQALGLPSSLKVDFGTLKVLASVSSHLGHRVDLLVDVGAHTGSFAVPANHILGAREVICIEPNQHLLPILRDALKTCNARIYPFALADKAGSGFLNIHQDPSMSSLLESNEDILRRDFDTYDCSYVEPVRVPVKTLGEVLSNYVLNGRRFFLKLDTQGNELAILRGGIDMLKNCDGILTEYMFTTPYSKQPSFESLISFLSGVGFYCSAVLDIKRKPSHRVSGVDFLFLPRT